jgi:hypothetical protein
MQAMPTASWPCAAMHVTRHGPRWPLPHHILRLTCTLKLITPTHISSHTLRVTHIALVHNACHTSRSASCAMRDSLPKFMTRIARRWPTLLVTDQQLPTRHCGNVGAITAAKCPHNHIHACTHPKRRARTALSCTRLLRTAGPHHPRRDQG